MNHRPLRPDPTPVPVPATAREDGSIGVAVPALALVLLLLAGLVVDSARQLDARGQAVGYAEEAARAGAAAVDLDSAELRLAPEAEVRARVVAYCRDAVAAGAPIRDPDGCFRGIDAVGAGDPRRLVVQAHVDVVQPASLLGLVGVRELHASGEGRARPVDGIRFQDAR
ncbi:pilus assembly protein TadG-related protein [Kineococcus gynurae]|uniref:Pilus assembly protein TadG-related protein n=1 Tax=Kineococcus gynurae TaxID=452979 RepID=A0ABV5LXR8_9ACTN